MSLPAWAIGGGALALGFKAQGPEAPGTVRRAAFLALHRELIPPLPAAV